MLIAAPGQLQQWYTGWPASAVLLGACQAVL